MSVDAVWTPGSLIGALVGGLLFGLFVVTRPIRDTRFSSLGAPAGLYGVLVTSLMVAAGIVFYAGQVLDALIGGDPQVDRVVSRFLVWLLYAAATGIGTYLGLRVAPKVDRRGAPRS